MRSVRINLTFLRPGIDPCADGSSPTSANLCSEQAKALRQFRYSRGHGRDTEHVMLNRQRLVRRGQLSLLLVNLLAVSSCSVVPDTPEASALVHAIRARDSAKVETLLANGSSPKASGVDEPILVAVAVQDLEIVKLLVDAGADPKLRLADGTNLLHEFAANYDLKRYTLQDELHLMNYLVSLGADPCARGSQRGITNLSPSDLALLHHDPDSVSAALTALESDCPATAPEATG